VCVCVWCGAVCVVVFFQNTSCSVLCNTHVRMKKIDITRHNIVKCGVEWPYDVAPNCKDIISKLERNEALVTWLQPIGGSIDDQFPVIKMHDKFYTMSLRMMKAIWRHVRLKRGFVNRELIPHVGVKLRIPAVLLMEKLRTQQRFNVSSCVLFFSI
jgi:hypothetical protein